MPYITNEAMDAKQKCTTKVVHLKRNEYDVRIDRATKWGNPFRIAKGRYTRVQAIDQYRKWIQTQPELMAALPELKGKVLGCWCKPNACHGDILAELADYPQRGSGRGTDHR